MGGGSLKSNPTKARKRVEATEDPTGGGGGSSLVRAKDGSAFTRWYPISSPSPSSAFPESLGFSFSLIFYILSSVFQISIWLCLFVYGRPFYL